MADVQLSIRDLIVGAYREVLRDARVVLTIGLVPSVVGATSVYTTSILRTFVAPDDKLILWALYLANGAVTLAAITLVAVSWHRLVLLKERPTSVRASLGARHFRFWLWSILLVVLTEFPSTVVAGYFQNEVSLRVAAIQAVAWVLLAYAQARLSLLLPATALDRAATVSEALRLSSGNGVRLAVAMVVVLVPLLFVVGSLVLLVPVDLTTREFEYSSSAVPILCGWALMPFFTCTEVGVLSLAYRKLERIAV